MSSTGPRRSARLAHHAIVSKSCVCCGNTDRNADSPQLKKKSKQLKGIRAFNFSTSMSSTGPRRSARLAHRAIISKSCVCCGNTDRNANSHQLKKILGNTTVESNLGNIGFKCMGYSTEKSVQYLETSSIPEKHETANNKRRKKKTVRSTQPSIPPEIIIEILSWLPVKILLRLMCVCKQWYAIIQDHHFIEKHISRAIVATNQYNRIVEKVVAGSFQFICGCDGLLLKMNNVSYKYCIKNPTTCQVLELPDPHKGSFDIFFCFIPSTGDYKLVSIYDIDGKNAGNEGCEVLTVGTDDSWRPLKVPNLHDLNKKRERASVIVSAGTTVHCIQLLNAGSTNIYQEVVSLDVETECFTVTPLPQDLLPDWKKVEALSWNGKLSFVNRVQEDLNVLVLEDHKKQKWGERFVFSLKFLKENPDMMVNLVPLFAEHGDMWFTWNEERIFAYNMDSGKILHTQLAPKGYKIAKKFYRCPPSLVTLKGMRPQIAQPEMNRPS